MKKTFTTQLESFDYKQWQRHFPVPDPLANSLIRKGNRRVLVWFQDQGPFHMALMKSKAYWYLLASKSLLKQVNITENQILTVYIQIDESQYGHELPEEMEALMTQDPEGLDYFKKLSPGKQRSLIYLVSKVKNPESRIQKSLAIFHHLKQVKGALDFKQLQETIKAFNSHLL